MKTVTNSLQGHFEWDWRNGCMDCAIIHDSSHVTVALFSDVILCMQYFCAGFTYMRVNLYILCIWSNMVVKGRVVLQWNDATPCNSIGNEWNKSNYLILKGKMLQLYLIFYWIKQIYTLFKTISFVISSFSVFWSRCRLRQTHTLALNIHTHDS